MNMFGFDTTIFDLIEAEFPNFINQNKQNILTSEFLIPDLIEKSIKNYICQVKVLNTTAKWYGVTYKEDKPEVVAAIKGMISSMEYPDKLWN